MLTDNFSPPQNYVYYSRDSKHRIKKLKDSCKVISTLWRLTRHQECGSTFLSNATRYPKEHFLPEVVQASSTSFPNEKADEYVV